MVTYFQVLVYSKLFTSTNTGDKSVLSKACKWSVWADSWNYSSPEDVKVFNRNLLVIDTLKKVENKWTVSSFYQ